MAITTAGLITLGHLLQREFDELDPDAQHDAFLQIAQAVAGRLENEVTHFSLHRDETALHAHFMMPARRMGDCALMSEILTPAVMRELQDIAFEVTQRFTPAVQRGTPARLSGIGNLSVRGLHRKQAEDIAKREARLQELSDLLAAQQTRLTELAEATLAENIASARRAVAAHYSGARASAQIGSTKAELASLKGSADAIIMRFAAEGLKHALAALSSAQQQLEAQASGAFSPRGEWLMRNIETLREVRRRAGQDPHQKVNHRLEGPRRELHNLYGPQLLTLKDTVKALFSELPAVEFSDPTDYTEAMRQQQVLWSQAALMVDRYLTGAPASIEAAALSELLDYFPSYPDFLAELKKRIAADEARYVLAETLVALPTRDTTTS